MAFESVSQLTSSLSNPFEKSVTNPFRGADFPEGFLIEEVAGAKEKVRLVANMMPMIPFSFGGEQRIKKDYYAGSSEPVTQILGSQESDVTIKGRLKDKRYGDNSDLYGVSTEIQQQIDAMRIRGNLCRFALGEWERYGFIQKTNFDMKKLSDVSYEITFFIVGFNAPRNAIFLQKKRIVPFKINKELIEEATAFAEFHQSQIPETVPQDLSDLVNGFVGDISAGIATLTGFVDQIIETVGDIQKSISRVTGLVSFIQGKISSYQDFASNVNPFEGSSVGITSRYKEASFYSNGISQAGAMAALLNRYRDQFNSIALNSPLGRHMVRTGDNLQKISNKFYGNADSWKEIYDYNDLQSTELQIGVVLEIPRI